ncbi:calmodulin-binding transcription activator 2 isoform X2 [Canna indica]|uniref:Calmodulin-binding transcription activator 2 isoform X2 n=1 Tax=Canna indica TaxID=4628 RepID=A0AAQ3QRA2_9LILI|nr:calmodulin-binding transcription activator 2 isoform X2 [Canna indica]
MVSLRAALLPADHEKKTTTCLHLGNFLSNKRKHRDEYSEELLAKQPRLEEADHVELNLEAPLPLDWQRCLDIKSGKIYFYNTRTKRRTSTDPTRLRVSLDLELNLTCEPPTSHDEDEYSLPWMSTSNVGGGEMVAAVCMRCHMLVMMSKDALSCPNCKFVHPPDLPIRFPVIHTVDIEGGLTRVFGSAFRVRIVRIPSLVSERGIGEFSVRVRSMASARRGGLIRPTDFEQILVEAQHRWLRPAEIYELLQNYRKFRIAPEPQYRPPSGSLFLFNRKVLRYFRKDGYTWRKKKDGKIVKEAHERLKVGSVDKLHCYYAHGEENENLQRRSYWILEKDLMDIVLVHYREVKDKSRSRSRNMEVLHDTQSAVTSNSATSQSQLLSLVITADSCDSVNFPDFDDAESAYFKRNSIQPTTIKEVPDTTLSLRCGGTMMDQ